jgi:hypothetical protein
MGTELSKDLARDCGLEWLDYIPLPTIASYYEFFFKRKALNNFLSKKIDNRKISPSQTLQTLMQVVELLEQRGRELLVITTNYDQHFERAYEAQFNRSPNVIIYNGGTDANDAKTALHVGLNREPDAWYPRMKAPQLTYLYKMHGCISLPGEGKLDKNLVVTEEDYINFLANALSSQEQKKLLRYVLAKISEASTLFIGYSLEDWNFRVVFKATAEKSGKTGYAVQLIEHGTERDRINRAMVEFWDKKNVDIINADARLFVEDLAAAMKEDLSGEDDNEQ